MGLRFKRATVGTNVEWCSKHVTTPITPEPRTDQHKWQEGGATLGGLDLRNDRFFNVIQDYNIR